MRVAVVLACLGVATCGPVLAADPPEVQAASGNDAPSPVQEPAAARPADPPPVPEKPAAAVATASSPAAAGAEPDMAQLEKRMHAMGYSTVMKSGQKYFCRRDEVLGTRLNATTHCMTPNEALSNRQQQDFEFLQQRLQTGCLQGGAHKAANCGN
jgi:hypothetical protein